MEQAYDKASAGGTLPVNPRQIYYAARRSILLATGADALESGYFLQTLLPAYIDEYNCDKWDLIWDARGHFTEPHTGEVIPVGTLEVRQYVGDRPELGDPITFDPNALYPTRGPENRYNTVLFVEKEGFAKSKPYPSLVVKARSARGSDNRTSSRSPAIPVR